VQAVTEELDLRGEVCPYTFVKTKLRLEELESGQDLIIMLDDSVAAANVSRSLISDGHEILDLKTLSGEVWQIIVKK
jgi:tRNA 2-thiouridine synthesizing protein A